MNNKPTIVTNWDSMPPEVYAEGELYSTRVLAANYRKLEEEAAAQAQEIDELKALLTVAACPANCTDGAYPDNHGEPVQCQFCYERNEVLGVR